MDSGDTGCPCGVADVGTFQVPMDVDYEPPERRCNFIVFVLFVVMVALALAE